MISSESDRATRRCTGEISWDGTICEGCRRAVDLRLAATEDLSDSPSSHTIASMRHCAGLSCKACALVLAWLPQFRQQEMEDADAEVLCNVKNFSQNGSHGTMYYRCSDKYEDPFWSGVFKAYADESKRHLNYAKGVDVKMVRLARMVEHEQISDTNTGSDEAFEKMRRWLKSCKAHEPCASWRDRIDSGGQAPRRVLKVQKHHDHIHVALIETESLPSRFDYITLSHCWGKQVPIRLLKRNISSFKNGIAYESLPKTFRDAAEATVNLGFSHLWIDALCIMQDDQDDWNREAVKMSSVYSNAYLNLSAQVSSDSNGGLFRTRDPAKIASFSLPVLGSADDGKGYHCFVNTWSEEMDASMLSQRAWVIQEKILSPRLIHFGLYQVYWQCLQRSRCELHQSVDDAGDDVDLLESGDIPTPPVDCVHESDRQHIYEHWYQTVIDYGTAILTYPSDRPIAIVGCAKGFQKLLGLEESDYIVGLWKPRLIHDLLYKTSRATPKDGPLIRFSNLPTWTWLSSDGQVWVHPTSRRHRERNQQNVAEIVSIELCPVGDAFGPVSSASITIKAPLCQVTLIRRDDASYDHPDDEISVLIEETAMQRTEALQISLDDRSEESIAESTSQPAFLILIKASAYVDGQSRLDVWGNTMRDPSPAGEDPEDETRDDDSKDPFYHTGDYEGLVIQPNLESKGQFKRIGYFHCMSEELMYLRDVPYTQALRNMRYACGMLDRGFRGGDVPDRFYEDVDEERMYTVTLV